MSNDASSVPQDDVRPVSVPMTSRKLPVMDDLKNNRRSSWPLQSVTPGMSRKSSATNSRPHSPPRHQRVANIGLPSVQYLSQQQQQRVYRATTFDDYVPPDGGWGWVCVGGAFVNFFLVVGLTRSFGAIYSELRAAFPNSTHSQIATIPSIVITLVVGLAIVAGALSKRFSCRCVAVAGSIICSTAICMCYYAHTLSILTICFIGAGIGAAMSTTPGILTIAMYFRKKRALATGICLSGTAIGSMVQPPLLSHLTRKLGFRHALLILGCVMYTTCIASMTFRDPVQQFHRNQQRQAAPPRSSVSSPTPSSPKRPPEKEALTGSIFLDQEIPSLTVEGASSDENDQVSLVNAHGSYSKDTATPLERDEEDVKAMDYIAYDIEYVADVGKDKIDDRLLNRSTSLEDLDIHQNGPTIKIYSPVASPKIQRDTPETSRKSSTSKDMNHSYLSVTFVNQKKRQSSITSDLDMENLAIRERRRTPTLTSLSMASFLLQFETHAEARYSIMQHSHTNVFIIWVKQNLYVDLTYMKNSVFLVVFMSSTLLLAVYPTGLIFMPPYSISQGIEKTMASVLLSVSAAGDLVGRLGCGWILDKNLLSKQYVYMGGIAVLGTSYLLFAASNMYWLMALCACTYGMSGGLCFLTLPIMLADHHGPQNLGSTFGLARIGQAMVGIAIPPLAGYLRDVTNSFIYSFMLMGCTALLGGVIAVAIPLVKRNYRRKAECWARRPRRPDTDF